MDRPARRPGRPGWAGGAARVDPRGLAALRPDPGDRRRAAARAPGAPVRDRAQPADTLVRVVLAVRDAVLEADRRQVPRGLDAERLRLVGGPARDGEAARRPRPLLAAVVQVALELLHPRLGDAVRGRAGAAADAQLEHPEVLRAALVERVAQVAGLADVDRGGRVSS